MNFANQTRRRNSITIVPRYQHGSLRVSSRRRGPLLLLFLAPFLIGGSLVVPCRLAMGEDQAEAEFDDEIAKPLADRKREPFQKGDPIVVIEDLVIHQMADAKSPVIGRPNAARLLWCTTAESESPNGWIRVRWAPVYDRDDQDPVEGFVLSKSKLKHREALFEEIESKTEDATPAESAPWLIYRGMVLLESESRDAAQFQFAEVIDAFAEAHDDTAAKPDPKSQWARCKAAACWFRGWIAFESRQFELALSDYLAFHQLHPEMAEAMLKVGIVQVKLGDFDKAIEFANMMIKRQPQSGAGWLLRAQAKASDVDSGSEDSDDKAKQQKYADAAKDFRRAGELAPSDCASYVGLAHIAIVMGQWDEAIEHCKKANERNDSNWRVWAHLGRAYRHRNANGDGARAINALKKAFALSGTDDGHGVVAFELASHFKDAEEYEEAIAWYDRGLERDVASVINNVRTPAERNNRTNALVMRVICLTALGRKQEAVTSAAAVLEEFPQSMRAAYWAIVVSLHANDHAEAVRYARHLLAIPCPAPNSEEKEFIQKAQSQHVISLFKLKRYADAKEAVSTLLSTFESAEASSDRDPAPQSSGMTHAQAQLLEAVALFELKDFEAAEKAFDKTMALDPISVKSLKFLAIIKMQREAYRDALRDATQGILLCKTDAQAKDRRELLIVRAGVWTKLGMVKEAKADKEAARTRR